MTPPTLLLMGAKFSSQPHDIVIVVVGPSGAGKSSLINIATGRNDARVGNSLAPCTTVVQSIRCKNGDRQVTFVDTPAFQQDDIRTPVHQLESQLQSWMKKAQVKTVTGILYLHKISDNRLTEPSASTMAAFGRLCERDGRDVSTKILLLTTMWDGVKPDVGDRREKELRTKYWQKMLNSGSRLMRFDKTARCVWTAVDLLIG